MVLRSSGRPAAAAGRRLRPCSYASAVTAAAKLVLAALVGVGALAVSACGPDQTASRPDGPTIAFLRATPSPGGQDDLDAFLAELAEGGYVPGRSLTLVAADPEEAHPDAEDAVEVVTGWAREGHELIVALSTTSARIAARHAPRATVLFLSNDPTATGLVTDERRPDGSRTGVSFRVPADRLVDLTRQVVSPLDVVGILAAGDDPASAPSVEAAVTAVEGFGMQRVVRSFTTGGEIPAALDRLVDSGADVVLLTNSPTLARHAATVQASVRRLGVPAVAATSVFDQALLVLEPDTTELYRQLGRQAARLLSGVPVSEVPVEDPSRFRLVVNTGTADALGIRLPPTVVEAADQVRR